MKKSESKTSQTLLLHDKSYLEKGFSSLAGVDEAGRGPLAGPVVAGAVIVRDFSFSVRIDDSKRMTAAARQSAYTEILEKACVGVSIIDAHLVDELNIYRASLKAMQEAVMKLPQTPDCILVDGLKSPEVPIKRFSIVGGDSKSLSIACASIVAKVTRDRLMEYYDEIYPQYGFGRHKGYGTREHLESLKRFGPCRIHRKSFEPVRVLLSS